MRVSREGQTENHTKSGKKVTVEWPFKILYIQWKPVKITPLTSKVNNRFTSTPDVVGPVFLLFISVTY